MPRWATVQEVAVYLRCDPKTIYNAIYSEKPLGKLFVRHAGVKRLADLDEVDSMLKGGARDADNR